MLCWLPIEIILVQLGPSGRHGVHAAQNVVRAKQKEAENVKAAQKDPDAVEKVHKRSAALRRNVQVSDVFFILQIISRALEPGVSEIKVRITRYFRSTQESSVPHIRFSQLMGLG